MTNRQYSLDLIKQMAECDANYIRLLKLVPQLRAFRNKSRVKKSYYRQIEKSELSGSLAPCIDSTLTKVTQEQLSGKVAEFVVADGQDRDGSVIVEIHVIESFKYTTTLEITQRPRAGKWINSPVMQVRVYHDASTAEVVSYQNHKNFQPRYSQPNPQMYHRDEKHQVNSFLGEWLTHCLQAGRCVEVPDIAFC